MKYKFYTEEYPTKAVMEEHVYEVESPDNRIHAWELLASFLRSKKLNDFCIYEK